MSKEEVKTILEETSRLHIENRLLVEKLTDPVLKQIIFNIHKIMVKELKIYHPIITSMNKTAKETMEILKNVIVGLGILSPNIDNRLNEMESMFDDNFTRIVELVESLRIIHEEEAESLDKLK